jgi:hypothetical protein
VNRITEAFCSGLIFPDTPIGGKHLGNGKT